MAEAGSHLQSLQTRLKNRHCPIQQQITFHLVKKNPTKPYSFSLSFNKNLCNSYRSKNSLIKRAKKQACLPTCFCSSDRNYCDSRLLTSRTHMYHMYFVCATTSVYVKPDLLKKILRQRSIKDQTGSVGRGNEKRGGGPVNFFLTASRIAVAFGSSLEIVPTLNSPYVPGDSQNQLIQSCAKEARDTSSQICWLLSRAR